MVVTFDPHPLQVLRPDEPPQLLTTTDDEGRARGGARRRRAARDPFHRGVLAAVAPRTSATDVLVGALGARQVSVGANFRFGHGARGDAESLRARPEFETVVVPLVEYGGEPVSSSRIRELVAAGDVRRRGRAARGALPARGRGGARRRPRARARHADRQPAPAAGRRDPGAPASTRRARTATRSGAMCPRRSASACGRPSRTTATCGSRPT